MAESAVDAAHRVTGANIAKAISDLGANGREFKFADVRWAVGVSGMWFDRVFSARVHNYLTELRKWGIVEVVPGARKRNKYFRIADEARLRRRLGPVLMPQPEEPAEIVAEESIEPAQAGAPIGRLSRLEQDLSGFDKTVKTLQTNLDAAIARIAELEHRVQELAAICS